MFYKKSMKKFLHLYIMFVVTISVGQINDSLPSVNDDYIFVNSGDSLNVYLDEVTVFPKHKYKEKNDIRYYYWFRKKVFNAYPYAVLASKRIDSVYLRLSKISSKRKKKKYVKKVQIYLEEELTKPLKKLTRTEGRILLKLIHRQSGKTAFNNIKELRSGWKAFWYNATANVFKLSLKSTYQPGISNEDFLIEDILQRSFIDEKLEVQQPKLQQDYLSIVSKGRGVVNVEVYKEMFKKQRNKRKKQKETNSKKK